MSGENEEKIETEMETVVETKTGKMKDGWDKAKIIAIIIGLIAIPCVIAYYKNLANKSRNEMDMFKTATSILREEPKKTESDRKARRWAINIVEIYTGKELGDKLETTPLSNDFAFKAGTSTAGTKVTWAKHIMSSYSPVAILSKPSGAEVYVNGKLIGETDLINLMPPGEYSVKLKLKEKEHVVKVTPPEDDIVVIDFDN